MPLNGPEDVPLKEYIREFSMVILIWDKDDNLIRKEEINYSDHKQRSWLGRVTHWACSNHYSVETMAKADYLA